MPLHAPGHVLLRLEGEGEQLHAGAVDGEFSVQGHDVEGSKDQAENLRTARACSSGNLRS
jgi:hypothetical protein